VPHRQLLLRAAAVARDDTWVQPRRENQRQPSRDARRRLAVLRDQRPDPPAAAVLGEQVADELQHVRT